MNTIKRSLFAAIALCLTVVSTSAYAHVKWFAPYDLEIPPKALDEVATPQFVYLLIASIVFMYVFFWVDRYLYRLSHLRDFAERWKLSEDQSFMIMRVSSLVFFVSVFVYGMTGTRFILTPELTTTTLYIPWLQLAAGLCAISRRTVPFTGAGILILYVLGIGSYGIFHMLDYLIFLGIAFYFLFSFKKSPTWLNIRYVFLFGMTALTLLWASVEKWGYPDWTYPLLENNPELLMGMTPYLYMLVAGFVEFNVTFILISSASFMSRVIAFGLNTVFIVAIYQFGIVDAVGHLMIIAILFVLILQGPTKARYFLVLSDKSLWSEAYFMTGLYTFAFLVIFMAYYGIYHLTY